MTTNAGQGDHEIDVEVREPAWRSVVRDPQNYCDRVASHVLGRLKETCELSIVLGDDELLQELNRTYRGKDEPTDVLSFEAGGESHAAGVDSQMRLLGDVVIAHGVATRDAAADLKISAEHHLAHLVVHGILHLLGYDHEIESEALEMESLEAEILNELGIADPYRVAVQPVLESNGAI